MKRISFLFFLLFFPFPSFRKNHREDYPYVDLEPVAGNYYPINSRIFINVITILILRSSLPVANNTRVPFFAKHKGD